MAVLANGDIALTDEGGGIAPQVVEVDPGTGARTLISGPGRGAGPALQIAQSLAVESTGNILVVDADPAGPVGNAALLRVLPNGDRSVLAAAGTGTGPSPARARSVQIIGGTIYLLTDTQLLTVDARTGSRTLVSGPTRGTGAGFVWPTSIAPGGTNGSVMVLDEQGSGGAGALVRVDLTTGNRTAFSDNSTPVDKPDFDNPIDFAYSACENAYYALEPGFNGGPVIDARIIRVDSTGARTLWSRFAGADNWAILLRTTPVPLPGGGGGGGGGNG